MFSAIVYLPQLSVAQNHKMPNVRIISDQLIGKDVEGSNRYPTLRYGPGICLERMNKTMKDSLKHCFTAETWTEHSSNRTEGR